MDLILVAFLANMVNNTMLAPNQSLPQDGLPMLYQCETYNRATIDPETFEMSVAPAYRNCKAVRPLTIPEYLDLKEQRKAL
jgi:hypothetical protein